MSLCTCLYKNRCIYRCFCLALSLVDFYKASVVWHGECTAYSSLRGLNLVNSSRTKGSYVSDLKVSGDPALKVEFRV